MAFDDETIDVLIGGYMSKDAAEDDYEAVLASGGYLHGAVVVSKDLKGELSVEQTDHMVREGAAGLGAVGFAVGLFAPPLLAATAVGAAIGAGAGKLLHRKTASKLEEQAGATIPVGGAGLIVAYPHSAAAKVEPVVTRAVKKAVGEAGATTSRPLRAPSPTRSRRWPKPAADATRRSVGRPDPEI
jgi:uncharacterized membrane protein